MANEYTVNAADLTAVADAIRAKGDTTADLAFPTGFASAIAAISSGAQVASGGTTVNRSTRMTISPGFTPKKICVGGGNINYLGYGLYDNGTKTGNIKSVSGTTITFNSEVSGTIYWLATSE